MMVLRRLTYFLSLSIAVFSLMLIVGITPANAFDTSDMKMEKLEKKMEEMEHTYAKLYHSQAEKRSPGLMKKITEHITFGGLIELEAFYKDNDNVGEKDTSDFVLATVEIGFEATVNEFVSGEIVLLWEEDDTEELVVNTGTITIAHPSGLSFTAGVTCVPFGAFKSRMITNSLTVDLGETCETAAMLTAAVGPIELSGGAYNGHVDEGGDDRVEDFFAALTVTPIEQVTFGAYYISDFADTDGMTDMLDANFGADTIIDTVAGFGGFVSIEVGLFSVEGEYLGATESYNVLDFDVDGDGNGDRPRAFNMELAVRPRDRIEVAARWEGNVEAFDLPKTRYGGCVSVELFENVVLAVEYLQSEFHEETMDDVQTVTANLGVVF